MIPCIKEIPRIIIIRPVTRENIIILIIIVIIIIVISIMFSLVTGLFSPVLLMNK